jgi:hypothetical protein
MYEAKINKLLQENPFYGMEAMLDMFQQLPKVGTSPNKNTVFGYLKAAYAEAKTIEQKELFYAIMFSIGDISNREHNIYRKFGIKQPDQGGSSLRVAFVYCLEWMLTHSEETKRQFYSFLPAIAEFSNFENLFYYQLKTDRNKGRKGAVTVIKLPIDVNQVALFLAKVMTDAKTTDYTHSLIAKFLPRDSVIKPRRRTKVVTADKEKFYSKKLGKDVKAGDVFHTKTKILDQTVEREKFKFQLLIALSEVMKWSVIKHPNNTRFVGVENYKKMYNRMSEAFLFSSKEILNWDKDQFMKWLDTLPAGARYRVQRRVLDKDKNGKKFTPNGKWINTFGVDFGTVFQTWEKGKEVAQEVLLNLTEEDKKSMTKEDLKKVQKAARVTTGADTLPVSLAKWKKGNLSEAESKLVMQSILDKIKVEVPIFVYSDVSASMTWEPGFMLEGVKFYPREMADIAATAFLMKNPKPELGSIIGVFSSESEIIADNNYTTAVGAMNNKYMHRNTVKGEGLLVDKTKSFVENYQKIQGIMRIYQQRATGTNIGSVSTSLKRWVDSEPAMSTQRIEMIQQYPIHLYISDGEFNGYGNAKDGIMKHRQQMKQWFGWDGLMIIWDVKAESKMDGKKFDGVPNVMYFGSNNIGTLNQIFTNINDLDIVDTFLPLKAMHNSNRYAPVKALINQKVEAKAETKAKKTVS